VFFVEHSAKTLPSAKPTLRKKYFEKYKKKHRHHHVTAAATRGATTTTPQATTLGSSSGTRRVHPAAVSGARPASVFVCTCRISTWPATSMHSFSIYPAY